MISVIVPVFNKANRIFSCITSIVGNSEVSEIILVDDCSTDDSLKVIREVVEKFQGVVRIKIVELTHNSGPSIARNIGVSQASENLIAFNDADDFWLSNKIKMQMNFYGSENDLIIGNMRNVFPNGKSVSQKKHLVKGDAIENILMGKISCNTPTMLMNKNLFRRVGGFDEKLKLREDHDLMIRLLLSGAELKICDKDVAIRNVDSSSYSMGMNYKKKIYSELRFLNKHKIRSKKFLSKSYLNIMKVSGDRKVSFKLFKRLLFPQVIELMIYKCLK